MGFSKQEYWSGVPLPSPTISWSLLKFISIESVMLSNHLILCCHILLLPSIFPSIRVFSNESALRIRWPKYCSFSLNISPSNEYSGLTSSRIDWFDLAVQGTSQESSGGMKGLNKAGIGVLHYWYQNHLEGLLTPRWLWSFPRAPDPAGMMWVMSLHC